VAAEEKHAITEWRRQFRGEVWCDLRQDLLGVDLAGVGEVATLDVVLAALAGELGLSDAALTA